MLRSERRKQLAFRVSPKAWKGSLNIIMEKFEKIKSLGRGAQVSFDLLLRDTRNRKTSVTKHIFCCFTYVISIRVL